MNAAATMPDGISLEKTPTKRLLLATDAFLPHAGGSRVYYYELYQNLVQRHPYTVTVLTGKVPGWEEFDTRQSNRNFRIRRPISPMASMRYEELPNALPAFTTLYRELKSGGYDQLHCGDLFPQALAGAFARPIWRKPVLMFCHGDEISQTDQRRFQPKVRDRVYKQARILIAANEFARQGLLNIGIDSSRIHKILPGVDLGKFKPSPKRYDLVQKYGITCGPVLLTVARLVPRKGVQTLVAAMPEILSEFPNAKLLVVGDGPQRAELEKMASEMSISTSVVFAGNIDPGEVSDYYNLCDVFAMANQSEAGGDIESFGMVFVEANAVGKPVVGGRSGGTSEAVLDGKTGFLCEPKNPASFASAIRALFRTEGLRLAMAETGRERAVNEFRWADRADQFHEILSASTNARLR